MFYEDDFDHIENISYSNFNFQKIYLNDIREFWLGIKENINTQVKLDDADVLEFTDQLVAPASTVMKCIATCLEHPTVDIFVVASFSFWRCYNMMEVSRGILSVSWSLVTHAFAVSEQDAVFKSSRSGNRRGTGQEQWRPQKETDQSLTQ